MFRHRWLIGLALGLLVMPAAQAGLFSKKPKETPEQRVAELVGILQTDTNEGKRESAAEELREYDPKQFPQIVSVLMESLQHDPKPGVRAESAISLGKLRPVTAEVGAALEQALTKDASARVRVQVRTTLWEYRLAGYRSGHSDGPPVPALAGPPPSTNAEPPLAGPTAPQPQPLPPPPVVGPRLTPIPAPASVAKPPMTPNEPPLLEPPLAAPELGPPLIAPK